jgi:hypothetical protein
VRQENSIIEPPSEDLQESKPLLAGVPPAFVSDRKRSAFQMIESNHDKLALTAGVFFWWMKSFRAEKKRAAHVARFFRGCIAQPNSNINPLR